MNLSLLIIVLYRNCKFHNLPSRRRTNQPYN